MTTKNRLKEKSEYFQLRPLNQELERHLKDHDEQIQAIFRAIRQLMAEPQEPRKQIGFQVKEKHSRYAGRIK